jgi:4-alpha-glucanotransferase
MSDHVTLLLGVHAHQPVGNFDSVVDDAHARCYRPFLQTVSRYPQFRCAVHFSGWLFEQLLARYPEEMQMLRAMVERGQVELFGGGDMEPVLAAIPARDRVGQVNALSERLARWSQRRPRGAWLTERVWEATLVPALADAGIEYVPVDDYHFLCAGKSVEELTRFFTTEEDGRRLDLFPISEALRYRIPFAPAHETVKYIEELGAHDVRAAAIYFDDIEKFGIWPETYNWVYERKWLEHFIEGVLSSPRITTAHFSDYRNAVSTRGIIYLPTTSYIEMNEWTLPAPRANAYAALIQQEKAHGRYERDKAFLRGGIWKNFLSRYPESNWMHKRMLGLSARVASLPPQQRDAQLTALLYQAQANDAYWHGLFGGLYLPHLRRAVYNAMTKLEARLDRLQPRPPWEERDHDLDGSVEVFLQNGILQAVVRDDQYGAIIELDSYSLAHNFGDTLSRRAEHYYSKLGQGNGEQRAQHEGIASAHDRVRMKHEIGAQDIEPDARPRALFVDEWTDRSGATSALAYQRTRTVPLSTQFQAPLGEGHVRKDIRIADNRVTVTYSIEPATSGRFTTRLDLAMPSCDGMLGRYVHEGRIPGGFGHTLELEPLTTLALEDALLGGSVELLCSPPAHVVGRPHTTVSQSEDGFEKVMQAVSLQLSWELDGLSHIIVALEIRRQTRM